MPPKILTRTRLASLVALVAILLIFCAGLFYRQYSEELKRTEEAMKNQADVLILALEGASRSVTHMGTPRASTRMLVEEVAKQPDIAYLAITDDNGVIVAHSEPSLEGKTWRSKAELDALTGVQESTGGFREDDGMRVYEVGKQFTPAFSHGHRNRPARPGFGRWREYPEHEGQSLFVFVGVDPEEFEAALTNNIRSSVLLPFFMALAILSILAMFYYIRGYRDSTRLLRDSRSLTQQLFANLPIGIFTTAPDGVITLSNRHAEHNFKIPAGGRGKSSIHDYRLTDWRGLMAEADKGAPVLERETTLALPGGRNYPVSITVSRISDGDGNDSGYLFIIRDLAEVKKLQKQLRLSERLSALGSMAAGVAHEIRNPLSTIKGYATYLAGKFRQDDPASETARMMIQEVERLNRVVSDLLSVARAGRINTSPSEPLSVLEHAVRLAQPEAEAKRVALSLDASADSLPASVIMDSDKIIQALLNLLINAVQATEPDGSVKVSAGVNEGHGGDPDSVYFSVSDTGKGMTHEETAQVFTPYFTTKASGTGLGLTIAHGIVEQHGGDISINSAPGRGSTFTVTIPVARQDDEAE